MSVLGTDKTEQNIRKYVKTLSVTPQVSPLPHYLTLRTSFATCASPADKSTAFLDVFHLLQTSLLRFQSQSFEPKRYVLQPNPRHRYR